jgi:hypothetical protein
MNLADFAVVMQPSSFLRKVKVFHHRRSCLFWPHVTGMWELATSNTVQFCTSNLSRSSNSTKILDLDKNNGNAFSSTLTVEKGLA